MMDKLLTSQEVADALGCHGQSVYRNKELPRIEIPGVGIRYREKDLVEYLEQHTVKAMPLLPTIRGYDVNKLIGLDEFDKLYLKQNKGGISGSMKKKKTRWNYGFGSVYIRETKQGKSRWYVDYQAKGKRIREVVKNGQNREEAVLCLKEKVTEAFERGHNPTKGTKRVRFVELAEMYIEDYAKTNKKSWKIDGYRIEAHMVPHFGECPLVEIAPQMIERYRAKRLEEGVSKSTTNREITVMKKMFNLAIDWNLTDKNPVVKVKLFSEKDTQKERILLDEEELTLLAESPAYLRPILAVAINTGMRRGEILNLKWKQTDLSKRQIRVVETKSGKNRIIPINDYLFPELLQIKQANGDGVFVFPNPKTGKPYGEVRKSFKNACSRAGIEDLRFHDLRHTFATRLIESGVDIITVRDLLGHFSIRVTQRYTHSNQNLKREAVQLLAKRNQKGAENAEDLAHICHIDPKEDSNNRVNDSFSVN